MEGTVGHAWEAGINILLAVIICDHYNCLPCSSCYVAEVAVVDVVVCCCCYVIVNEGIVYFWFGEQLPWLQRSVWCATSAHLLTYTHMENLFSLNSSTLLNSVHYLYSSSQYSDLSDLCTFIYLSMPVLSHHPLSQSFSLTFHI